MEVSMCAAVLKRCTHKLVLLDHVVGHVDHNVIIFEDLVDLAGDPCLDDINVDLLRVDLLVKFRRKLGLLKDLLGGPIERHLCGVPRSKLW